MFLRSRCPGSASHLVSPYPRFRYDLTGQSRRSRSGCAVSEDSYLTRNNLVQQATLPSTGLTTHNNYWNIVISNILAFSPTWVGTFVSDASQLHLTQTAQLTLGFALTFR